MKVKDLIIIILLLILVGIGGYWLYDKLTFDENNNSDSNIEDKQEPTTENKKPTEDTNNEKTLNTNDQTVIELYNNVNVFEASFMGNYNNYLYKYDSISVNELPNDVIVFMGIQNIKNDNNSSNLKFSAQEVKKGINNVFGNINYTDVSTDSSSCENYVYNEVSKNFTLGESGCGGAYVPVKVDKLLSATKYNDRIEIVAAVVFGKSAGTEQPEGTYNYYSDVNYNNLLTTNDVSSFDINNYIDKTSQYKYTFKLENGNYYFKSIEKIQ